MRRENLASRVYRVEPQLKTTRIPLHGVASLLLALFLPFQASTSYAQAVYYTSPGQSAGAGAISSFGTPVVSVTGLNRPAGLAVDSAGNVYYGDYSTGNGYTLYEQFSGGGGRSFGLVTPPLTTITPFVFSIAANAAGDVYYTTFNSIVRIDHLTGPTTVVGGLNHPAGLAVDGAGNVYYCDYSTGNGYVLYERFSGGGGRSLGLVTPPLTIITPFVFSIAANAVGDVYYTTFNSIVKIDHLTGPGTLVGGLNHPAGLAVDGVGNVYYGDYSGGYNLYEILACGGSQSFGTLTPALTNPTPYLFSLAASPTIALDYFGVGVDWEFVITPPNLNGVRGDRSANNLYTQLQTDPQTILKTGPPLILDAAKRGTDNASALTAQFNQFRSSVCPGDTVLFYAASHGCGPSGGCPDPRIIIASDGTGLNSLAIANLLMTLPSSVRKIVILDACHVGGMGHDLTSVVNTSVLAASSIDGTLEYVQADGTGVFTDALIQELYNHIFDLNQIAIDITNDRLKFYVNLIGQDLLLADSGSAIFNGLQPEFYEASTFRGNLVSDGAYTVQSPPRVSQANVTNNAFQMTLTNMPSSGSVAIEMSPNLVSWLQVGFTPAGGTNFTFNFPTTNNANAFFKAKVIPQY
jgi:caspase domain-containing protein